MRALLLFSPRFFIWGFARIRLSLILQALVKIQRCDLDDASLQRRHGTLESKHCRDDRDQHDAKSCESSVRQRRRVGEAHEQGAVSVTCSATQGEFVGLRVCRQRRAS
jgi:hypothetical protein